MTSAASDGAWTTVRTDIEVDDAPFATDALRQEILAVLFDAGAGGVHESDTTFITHFPPATDVAPVIASLQGLAPTVRVASHALPQVDWSVEWKRRITAHQLGAIVVAPPWLASEYDPAHTVVIEPGMAFGTGDHATTRCVIRLLPEVLRRGDVIADLGAGSAILSIAAAKLGAVRVYAIELDEEAIPDAEANVRRNGVEDIVHVFAADAGAMIPLLAPVRLALANIISSVLIELLPQIASALTPDGAAILSGILLTERDTMLEYLRETGWVVRHEAHEDIWWAVWVARG